VWYDGRPPGQQPPPSGCREAERIASRDRYARVIYGGDRDRRDDGWWDRDDDRRDPGGAIPRRDPYPNRTPYPNRYPYPESRYPDRYPNGQGPYGHGSVPFYNGHKDGYDRGLEDARDRSSHDPVRQSRYRSADRGYDRRYGTKEQYKEIYRQGFREGYDEGYRDAGTYGGADQRGRGSRFPWPF
jgi:hypothetical protein